MNTRKNYKEILVLIQALFQNEDIVFEEKNELMNYVKAGIKINQYPNELFSKLKQISYLSDFQSQILMLLDKFSEEERGGNNKC